MILPSLENIKATGGKVNKIKKLVLLEKSIKYKSSRQTIQGKRRHTS
jgi:hypothetical protein